jgi:hypothetical protein
MNEGQSMAVSWEVRQAMNIVLWVLQVLLAAAFFAHGWLLLFPPPEMLELMNAMFSTSFRVFLGAAEVMAAFGLILPAATRILPGLVPAAAAGIVVVMIAATVLHIARQEYSSAAITTVLLAMAAFVTYMRWKVRPIVPRRAA